MPIRKFENPFKKIGLCLLVATSLAMGSTVAKAEPGYDLLTITKIKTVRPAGGLDWAGELGFMYLGMAVRGGAIIASGGVLGYSAVKQMHDAAINAREAARFVNKVFPGQDDLIIKVDGKTVYPGHESYINESDGERSRVESGPYVGMDGGDVLFPDIKQSFRRGARISLVEHDWGSDSDDLGGLNIVGTTDQEVTESIVLSPLEEDGSIYLISYKIEANKGSSKDIVNSMLCGTNQCDECRNADCAGQNYNNLDRTSAIQELKSCPVYFTEAKLMKYEQLWPVKDVYLRVCSRYEGVVGTRHCANEGEKCQFSGAAVVFYGRGEEMVDKVLQGPVDCRNETFGGDPAPYNVKACFIER